MTTTAAEQVDSAGLLMLQYLYCYQ